MQMHIVRDLAARFETDLLEDKPCLRRRMFVEQRHCPGIPHILNSDRSGFVRGSRLASPRRLNLLQAFFGQFVQGLVPTSPSRGADWQRFYRRSDRREARWRTPGPAALFFMVEQYKLLVPRSDDATIPALPPLRPITRSAAH